MDNLPALMKRWQQALMKRREQAVEVRHAFDELKDIRTRLGYDILLIADITTSEQASNITNPMDTRVEVPAQIPSPTVTLALTNVIVEPTDLYKPVEPSRHISIQPLEHFAAMPVDVIKPYFDR
jgi:hypothetical protein